MRGFPFLNLLIALLLSGAVMLPLVYRATQKAPALAPVEYPAAAAAGGNVSSHVSLRFVHAPVSVRLRNGEVVLHEWTSPAGVRLLEESVAMPFNDSRAEFTAQITWPSGTPDTMVEIKVEPDGKPSRSANVWSSGPAADELVSLTWEGAAP